MRVHICLCVVTKTRLIVMAVRVSLTCDSDACHVECFLQEHSGRNISREERFSYTSLVHGWREILNRQKYNRFQRK